MRKDQIAHRATQSKTETRDGGARGWLRVSGKDGSAIVKDGNAGGIAPRIGARCKSASRQHLFKGFDLKVRCVREGPAGGMPHS